MEKKCRLCDKVKKAKGLCAMHYSKEYRKTEKGKLSTKKYNNGTGAKYLIEYKKNNPEKFKRVKRERVKKEDCLCGKPSIAKGFCGNCYAKNRRAPTLRKRAERLDYDILFKSVMMKISEGLNVSEACKALKIRKELFYLNISKAQKKEMKEHKFLYQHKHTRTPYY